MDLYRQVKLSIWNDSKFSEELSPSDKLLWLLVLTAPQSNQIGCYSITYKQLKNYMNVDDIKYISNSINKLKVLNMLDYDEETKELYVCNFIKHNWNKSDRNVKGMLVLIDKIKSKDFQERIISKLLEEPYVSSINGVIKDIEEKQRIFEEKTKALNNANYNLSDLSDKEKPKPLTQNEIDILKGVYIEYIRGIYNKNNNKTYTQTKTITKTQNITKTREEELKENKEVILRKEEDCKEERNQEFSLTDNEVVNCALNANYHVLNKALDIYKQLESNGFIDDNGVVIESRDMFVDYLKRLKEKEYGYR